MSELININFWKYENATQRMTRKDWVRVLLDGDDKIIANGHVRKLKARNLGAGVVEVYLVPLKEATE